MTHDTTEDAAYDFAYANRVAAALNDGRLDETGITAVAEEYDIGMAHIRLDPVDGAATGYVAIAAAANSSGPGSEAGWALIPTTRIATSDADGTGYYDTDEAPDVVELDLPLDTDPETVADAIASYLS